MIYTNVRTSEAQRFTMDQIPLGRTTVEPGRFYFCHHPLSYYHCDAILGDAVRWDVIESFQSGQLFSATYIQSAEWTGSYIPVTDKKILKRLEGRLADYRRRSSAPGGERVVQRLNYQVPARVRFKPAH